ncbi:MAG: methionyl-tRNA formyltransferase [Opitutales bacterium]
MTFEKPTRVVFMASDIIALPSLNWCAEHPMVELVGVITQPDRRSGRGKKLVPNPIKTWAQEHHIEVKCPERLSLEDAEWVRSLEVDISIVMAYGQFLKKSMLEAPIVDTVNLHGSILPAYRGACPVEASILNGDPEAGVSLMRLVKKMDAGPVYDVEKVAIDGLPTGPELRERVGGVCPRLLERALPLIVSSERGPVEQDPSSVSYVRRLFKTDAFIDFNNEAAAIERRSRALYPWPGTAIQVKGETLKLADLKVVPGFDDQAPGTVLEIDGQIGIACASGAIVPGQWQRPGGKMLASADFFRGFSLELGTVIESVNNPPVISAAPYIYAS